MEAWSSLHSKLQQVAPELCLKPPPFPGQAKLYDALATQSLQYRAEVHCVVHWAVAVLSACDSSAPQVVLTLERPGDYISTVPSS